MTAGAVTDDRETLTADAILDLLANRRRRYLVYALRGHSEPVSLTTLAEQVAGWEHDLPPEEVPRSGYKSVYVSSVQCHVPKLDECGVVDHDPDTHTVELAGNYDRLLPYLRLVVHDEPSHTRLRASLPGDEGLFRALADTVSRLRP